MLDRPPLRRGATWLDDTVIDPLLKPYYKTRQYVSDEFHLDIGAAHTLIYQGSFGNRDESTTGVSNFDFFGEWRLIEDETLGEGAAGFLLRDRRNFTDAGSAEFSAGLGSVWSVNDTNTVDDTTALIQLWWKQRLADDAIALTVGKIDQGVYFNRNRYAGSDKKQFMSQPMATNRARNFPGNGLGANLEIIPADWFYVSTGFGDANGDNLTSGFNSVGDGEFLWAFEAGWTPEFDDLGKGVYRFTVHHLDATDTQKEGWGLSLSFDQDFGDTFAGFARYSISDDEHHPVEQVLAGGFVIRDPFGHPGDMFGIGSSWSRPTASDDRDQYALELFYRLKLSRHIEVTPDIQFIFDPAENNESDPVVVLGMRLRAEF